MKRIFVLLVIATIFVSNISAQKIKKHEIDKFTKEEFIQTSSAKLINVTGFMRPHKFECYVEKHGEVVTLPANMQFDRENVNIDKESGVVFLLDNEETVRLYTDFIGEPNRFNEFSTCFTLSLENIEKLANHRIVSLRMLYVGGHYDADVKEKNQNVISNMLKLVNQ